MQPIIQTTHDLYLPVIWATRSVQPRASLPWLHYLGFITVVSYISYELHHHMVQWYKDGCVDLNPGFKINFLGKQGHCWGIQGGAINESIFQEPTIPPITIIFWLLFLERLHRRRLADGDRGKAFSVCWGADEYVQLYAPHSRQTLFCACNGILIHRWNNKTCHN